MDIRSQCVAVWCSVLQGGAVYGRLVVIGRTTEGQRCLVVLDWTSLLEESPTQIRHSVQNTLQFWESADCCLCMPMYIYIYCSANVFIHIHTYILYTYTAIRLLTVATSYGVATSSRLLKITGLFCRI